MRTGSLLAASTFGAIAFGSAVLTCGCAIQTASRPVEYLDERTATTVAALKEPIELVPSTGAGAYRTIGKRISFAYLGPVEWDKAGHYGYGLWVHVATGTDWTAADIRSSAAVTLVLDDGRVTLVPTDDPGFGRPAYQPIASWGQTTYFELDVMTLQRMAASRTLDLAVLGTDGGTMTFAPGGDTRAALNEFLRSRGITRD